MTTLEPIPTTPTIYEQMVSRGVSRRDFLKFCAWMGACIGLDQNGTAQIAQALETKRFELLRETLPKANKVGYLVRSPINSPTTFSNSLIASSRSGFTPFVGFLATLASLAGLALAAAFMGHRCFSQLYPRPF